MDSRKTTGQVGEAIACEYLKSKKYRILAQNFLGPTGELDIITRDPKGVLVFVEVKTLAGESKIFSPEQHFNEEKRFRVRRLAEHFANAHPEYVDKKLGYRIDLVAVSIKDPLEKDWQKGSEVRHYENV